MRATMVPGIKRMPVLPGAPRVATGSGSPKIDDASRRGGNEWAAGIRSSPEMVT
jgi:hypothetical protein